MLFFFYRKTPFPPGITAPRNTSPRLQDLHPIQIASGQNAIFGFAAANMAHPHQCVWFFGDLAESELLVFFPRASQTKI